jgi:hypothetical protein
MMSGARSGSHQGAIEPRATVTEAVPVPSRDAAAASPKLSTGQAAAARSSVIVAIVG